MRYLLGLDIGTSGTKSVLFSEEGAIIASASQEYPLYQPQNGWAEQEAEDWWQAVVNTSAAVLKKSGINPNDLAGIGLSGQMHGLVMLDSEGNVIRRPILWCDGRTGAECREIESLVGKARLIEISANPALTGFTAGKILWVRRHEPENYSRCRHILLPKDYIRYRLTGEIAAEMADASGTNLLDLPNRCWSGEILSALNIDPALMPRLYESSDCAGHVVAAVTALTGIPEGTPVAAGAGDNAAAAVGVGVVVEGKAFNTLGTSGVVFAHTDRPAIDPKGRVHTFCSAVPGGYVAMSCTLACGLSLQWLRNTMYAAEERQHREEGGTDPYLLIDQGADSLPIGADRLIYLPYLMGERSPILDADARGVFFGLSAVHTREHMARAVLEGIGYSQRQCLDVIAEMGLLPSEIMLCGGGAKSPVWRQMLADIYNTTVTTMNAPESAALGAAILGGVAAGVYPDLPTACEKLIAPEKRIAPSKNAPQYQPIYALYRTLYPTLAESFSKLSQLG